MRSGDDDKGKVDTLRPEANPDGSDMYSSATVVRALPADFVAMMNAANEKAIAEEAEAAAARLAPTSERPAVPPPASATATATAPRPNEDRVSSPPVSVRSRPAPPDSSPGSVPPRSARPSARAVARPPAPWQKLVLGQKPVSLPPPPAANAAVDNVALATSPLPHHRDAIDPDAIATTVEVGRISAVPVDPVRQSAPPLEPVEPVRPSFHERPTAVPTGDDPAEEAVLERAAQPAKVATPERALAAPASRPVTTSAASDEDDADEAMMAEMGRGRWTARRALFVVVIGIAIGAIAILVLRSF